MYYDTPVHKGEIFEYFRQEYDGRNNLMIFLKQHQGRTTYLNFILNYTIENMGIDLENCAIEFTIDTVSSFKQLIDFFELHTKDKRRYLLGIHIDSFKFEDNEFKVFDDYLKEFKKFKNQYVFFSEEKDQIISNFVIQGFKCKVFKIKYNLSQYYNIIQRIFIENHICVLYSLKFEDYLAAKYNQLKECSFTDGKLINDIIKECVIYKEGARIILEPPGVVNEKATSIKLDDKEKNIKSLREKIESDLLYDYIYKGEE